MDELASYIRELSDETLCCVKSLEREFELFLFEDEVSDELNAFLKMMRHKAIRIANPRDIHDIKDNVKRKVLKNEWLTSRCDS